MYIHRQPFLGSEAFDSGLVRKHELRRDYVLLFPDVYLHRDILPTLTHRARAAWLWSHREGVLAGLTASAMHGAKWVDDALPVEVIWPNARRPKGLRTYDYRLHQDEYTSVADMRITTVTRTAFDIGRRRGFLDAVCRLDALGNATRFDVDDVVALARRHRGARRVRQLVAALAVHDSGAESPKETWLRLVLLDAGFPRPRTQIPVLGVNGRARYYLDMGWEDVSVAVEYDGEHHRTDRASYRHDIIRMEYLQSLRWRVVRVTADDRAPDIVRRVHAARTPRLL